ALGAGGPGFKSRRPERRNPLARRVSRCRGKGVVGERPPVGKDVERSGRAATVRAVPKVPNPNGNPVSLVPAGPGNTRALKHAVYSDRLREPRAREIAEGVMTAPWATDLDELAAAEIGRLAALIESLEEALPTPAGRRSQASRCTANGLGRVAAS